MDVEFTQLTKEGVHAYLPSLTSIDKNTLGEKWTDAHFLYDLPGKWMLSSLVFYQGEVAGFLIASDKLSSIHIHRLAVRDDLTNSGIGSRLVKDLIAKSSDHKAISLKVAEMNSRAVNFYKRLGFIVSHQEGSNYLMHLNLNQ